MNYYVRFFSRLLIVLALMYIAICSVIYLNQESLLFHPKRIASKTDYVFTIVHTEKTIPVSTNVQLNGVLFQVDHSKGLVFFLHGNTGNLSDMEGPAAFYTSIGYDFFAFDYRGFGKSSGTITSEQQFYNDAQRVYNHLKQDYPEKSTIVIGYSIGTAAATRLAALNHPKKLVLMAPYYSMEELAHDHYPFFPGFLVNYKFETFRFLKAVRIPVLIAHGTNDGLIPFVYSLRLKKLLKKTSLFIPLVHENHGGVQDNLTFRKKVAQFLEK